MARDLRRCAESMERVTRVELAFSAWEFDQARFADLGRWTNGQVSGVFLVPARPPRSAEILSVVARMWHETEARIPTAKLMRAVGS
jgi:hypothetical protein